MADRYDVYWLELAISPSEEIVDKVSELRFDVVLGSTDALAFDLVPSRFGVEVNTTDKVNSPSITIGDVEVGEMFSRTVQYKYIRPTILSHGVQTPSFGWIFTGEALDASAKKVFADLGFAKGTKKVDLQFSLSAKFKYYWGFASQWGSTAPIPYTLQLPK